MEDADGVAGGVLETAHHAGVATGQGGCREGEGLEVVAADGLRAGEGEE